MIDSREASLAEAEDLIIPLNRGLSRKNISTQKWGDRGRTEDRPHVRGGDHLLQVRRGGGADVAASRRILDKAAKLGLGTEVEL